MSYCNCCSPQCTVFQVQFLNEQVQKIGLNCWLIYNLYDCLTIRVTVVPIFSNFAAFSDLINYFGAHNVL